jgi:hypothetical protein
MTFQKQIGKPPLFSVRTSQNNRAQGCVNYPSLSSCSQYLHPNVYLSFCSDPASITKEEKVPWNMGLPHYMDFLPQHDQGLLNRFAPLRRSPLPS